VRCSCLGRTALLLLVLLVLALSAMRGVAGSWAATPLSLVEWSALADGVGRGAAALLSAVVGAVSGLLGAVGRGLAAIPWRAGLDLVAEFVGNLAAGFAALVRDLAAAAAAGAAALARTLTHLADRIWQGTLGQLKSLARSPSGEPLDPGRLALFGAGWLMVLIVAAWFAVRLFGGWLRAAWRFVFRRGRDPPRRRSPARA
jgi:hypothetical protein